MATVMREDHLDRGIGSVNVIRRLHEAIEIVTLTVKVA